VGPGGPNCVQKGRQRTVGRVRRRLRAAHQGSCPTSRFSVANAFGGQIASLKRAKQGPEQIPGVLARKGARNRFYGPGQTPRMS
jgi:hypothetical protein